MAARYANKTASLFFQTYLIIPRIKSSSLYSANRLRVAGQFMQIKHMQIRLCKLAPPPPWRLSVSGIEERRHELRQQKQQAVSGQAKEEPAGTIGMCV